MQETYNFIKQSENSTLSLKTILERDIKSLRETHEGHKYSENTPEGFLFHLYCFNCKVEVWISK